MYSATNVASAVVDFVKGNVDDGVIDSPPSRSIGRIPIYLPCPLRSRSPTHQNVRTPQRQLYCKASLRNTKEAKEKDLIHYSVEVLIEPAIVSPLSKSHAAVPLRHSGKEGRLL
jgi:hypothetical protein